MEKKPTTLKPVNVKAPRFGKAAYTYQIVRRTLWEEWAKKTSNTMTFKEFVIIWDLIAEEICLQVIANSQGVRLPFFNGDMSLKYIEMLNKPINGPASGEVGKVITHLDWHSDRRPGKICWTVHHAAKRNRWVQLYGFKPCRKLERAASKEGFTNNPGLYQVNRTTEYNASRLQ